MRLKHAILTISLIAAGSAVPLAFAASQHTNHDANMHHEQTATASQTLPLEGGQSAFAAIAEIVALLKNDPNTDWRTVNIDALRSHLVDMSEVTLHAAVETMSNDTEIIFHVTGEGRTRDAIQAMVPAHSAVLTDADIYAVEAELTEDGARMHVTFSSPHQKQEISALGFFGIMATGAHHQAHHLQMATGSGHEH